MKVLSVIVPSYNMEKYLPKCLGSLVLGPELMDKLEVLVVNDGSKDRTSEIAHEFATKWPQTFVVIDKANGNYGSCVNAALPRLTGKYVKMLDADDSYDTEGLARFVEFLTVTDADLAVSNYDVVNEEGVVSGRIRHDELVGIRTFNEIPEKFCRTGQMQAVAYRADVLRETEYHQSEGISYTDQEWMLLPMSAVSTFVYFPEVVYKYLVGRQGQTVGALQQHGRKTILRIARRMTEVFVSLQNDLEQANARYFRFRLLWFLKLVYTLCLLESERFDAMNELAEFDDYLCRCSPVLYRETESFIPDLRLMRFRYVALWRRSKSDAGKIFFVYRNLLRIKRWAVARFHR